MLHTMLVVGAAATGFVSLAAPAVAGDAAVPPKFRLTDLGVLPGGTSSAAQAINDGGIVVGMSTSPDSQGYPHAVAWIDGAIVDITGLGISGARAMAVSPGGKVVGMSDELGLNAFAWTDGRAAELPAAFSCCSEALGINESGVIVGRAAISQGGTPNEGAIWVDGEFAPLPSLGFMYDVAYGINSAGDVVGSSDDGVAYRPVMWEGAGREGVADAPPMVLPTFGGFFSEAMAINDAGLIVGHSMGPNGTRAAVWQNGEIAELPAPWALYSTAFAVNDAGWVVGFAAAQATGSRAMVWIDGAGHDLNTLVAGEQLPEFELVDARGINASGQIVGEAVIDGAIRAFLLTPVAAEDLDADGAVDGADLGLVLSAWGRCRGCAEDLNGDGAVDGADLGLVLAAWGG
jgi:probable HAF family extracellular repeat protein